MAAPSADRSFERLYRKHVADVYRYASAVLSNSVDAEDVAQTVFLNAYRAYQGGDRPEQPLNWLIAITHNVCRQRFRDGARRPREVVLEDEHVASPFEEREQRYRREDIVRALSQLSLNQRAALALRELEGRSYGEIASILGMTTSAVETLIFRARRAFREQLEGSLTCNEAERAISLQLDGMLERGQRGSLRAHLRSCSECASLARRFRAQRSALHGIAYVPLPPALAGSFGAGGGAVVGTALGLKAVAFGTAALVAVGVGTTEVVRHSRSKRLPAAPAQHRSAAPSAGLASVQASSRSAGMSTPLGTVAVRSARTPSPSTHRRHAGARTPTIGRTGSPSVETPGSTPSGVATIVSIWTPSVERGVHKDTAVRQRPQLSGGGASHAHPPGVTKRDEHRPAETGGPGDPGSAAATNGHRHDPQKPDHPTADDHPGPNNHPGGRTPSQPESAPPGQQQEPLTLPDVTVPSTPGPPADPGPADVNPGGGPPVDTHDPPGKPKDVVPPIRKP
jgi:RNA polymerase sigma-70 factor (ECF subfamily)